MDNLLILKAERTNLIDFQTSVQEALSKQAKGKNLILDLLDILDLSTEDLLSFQELSDLHVASGCSFVLVRLAVPFNDLPETLHVVPTLQEAKDIIMMEDIERDLGF